ncbi:MAG: hypothetical protein JKY24_04745 [Pseudomonadales bacterium]|nr:hypothetical protein [Pseudomonadales bacterium]
MAVRDYNHEYISELGSSMNDTELLSIKLKHEILHLEHWLEMQKQPDRNPANSVSSTIEALIRTRRKLLDSIEFQEA